ncbi:hypothetical protein HanIR_Chr11g0531791 [Helianthus annuus]|nr:hypothetical protein HanIR_Chr11g0531791 [Helianthus annuus]
MPSALIGALGNGQNINQEPSCIRGVDVKLAVWDATCCLGCWSGHGSRIMESRDN